MQSPLLVVLSLLLLLLLAAPARSAITFGSLTPASFVHPGVTTDQFEFASTGKYFGLCYFDGDKDYSAHQFYTIRQDVNDNSFFDTINTGTSTATDQFSTAFATNIVTLAFAEPDVGYGSTIFYYLREDTSEADKDIFGTITPGALNVGAMDDLVVTAMIPGFDALTFASANVGHGANVFYYLRHDNDTCLSYFGVLDPGALTWYDVMPLEPNFDTVWFMTADAGWGPNLFYYLRHNSSNISTFGVLNIPGNYYNDSYTLGLNYNELAFTITDVGYGPNLFYYIKGAEFTCVPVTNATNATLLSGNSTSSTAFGTGSTSSGTGTPSTSTGIATTTSDTATTTAASTTGSQEENSSTGHALIAGLFSLIISVIISML